MLKRRRPRPLMMACSVFAGLILLLGACGAPSPGTTPSSTGGAPVKGGTWTDDLYEEPSSLIPYASSETFADLVDQALYAPLFVGDSTGHINPGITTEIPTIANGGVSADSKTWTFNLRANLKWSNGMPLHARDLDFSW